MHDAEHAKLKLGEMLLPHGHQPLILPAHPTTTGQLETLGLATVHENLATSDAPSTVAVAVVHGLNACTQMYDCMFSTPSLFSCPFVLHAIKTELQPRTLYAALALAQRCNRKCTLVTTHILPLDTHI